MKRKSGNRLIGLGVLLITAALILVVYNLWADQNAGTESLEAMETIAAIVSEDSEERDSLPLYKVDPNVEMPQQEINGIKYVGYLEIPTLELQLPVIGSTTNYYLTVAPCRFSGSAYLGNLVIGAHNYVSHFGNLKDLSYGDEVIFSDMEGNIFRYAVENIEILQPDQAEYLQNGEYPLTLYTCTIGGRTRVTIRCSEIE